MTEMLTNNRHIYRTFSSVLDRSIYEPLPNNWIIGMTDVVDSTIAINSGRYEDVNFLGASVIAAVGNALGGFDFPFSFGGDGATFALPAELLPQAELALKQIAEFSQKRFGLDMRAGLVSLDEIRSNGRDVRIARYAVSQNATYFMFAGGGIRWAERELKKGRFSVRAGTESMQDPDLTGLSCEWNPFKSQRGAILSLLVEPQDTVTDLVFSGIARNVIQVFDDVDRNGSPLPLDIPERKEGLDAITLDAWATVVSNSDFRKFDDVLRLTVDCTIEQVDQVEGILREARRQGHVRYGLHLQSHAIMTCLVPGTDPDSHLHFLDGQDGGFAKAAAMLRAQARD